MAQTREAMAQNLAERWCWQAARRDDSRVARRLYRTQVVEGVYRLDDGAWLDEFFHCRLELGVVDGLGHVQGTAIQRVMVPCVPYVLLYGLKILYGVERMHALPALLCSDAALMRWVGFKAHQVPQGVGQRGAATRQGPRTDGPIGPDTLAEPIVQLHRRDVEALFHGGMRVLAQTGVLAAKVTGMVDATDLETTAHAEGWGQVTRQRKITDTRGHGHEIEGTVDGWQLLVLMEAATKMPWAGQVVPSQAPEGLARRALVTQARTTLAGHARLHKVVCAKGLWAGTELWWRDQPRLLVVVPAKGHLAVTVDAQAQAAAGEGVTVGRRAPTVRQGQGNTAWTERLETEVVGIAGLTTYEPYGTPEPGRHANRRDFQPHPLTAVVVRQGRRRDDGPGGQPVFLPNAAVDQPLRPFDDDADRSLIENCWTQGKPAAVECAASAPENRAGGACARPVHLAAVRRGHGVPAAR